MTQTTPLPIPSGVRLHQGNKSPPHSVRINLVENLTATTHLILCLLTALGDAQPWTAPDKENRPLERFQLFRDRMLLTINPYRDLLAYDHFSLLVRSAGCARELLRCGLSESCD